MARRHSTTAPRHPRHPASPLTIDIIRLGRRPGAMVTLRNSVPNPARIQYTATHEVAKNCLRPYSTQPSVEHFSKNIQRAKCYHHDMQHISF